MIDNAVKRGDIALYDFGLKPGSIQNGLRPVLILQNNSYNESSATTIVAPISSTNKKNKMFSHIVLGARFGLLKRSMVMLEQLQTINKEALGAVVGHIDDKEIIKRIDRGLSKLLGIKDVQDGNELNSGVSTYRNKPKIKKPSYDPRDVMCLCLVCRDAYRHRGFRVLNVGGPKNICDYCNYRTGVDYAVVGLLSR